jgi:mono/diheme cytochrome c family protein
MVVFKLNGTATLPPEPPLAGPANPPDETFTKAQIEEGKKLYGMCANCHGGFPRASNIIPDLRRSGVLTSAPSWKSILIDGALTDRGMVSFKDYKGMTEAQAEAVRAYVASEAKKLQAEQAKGQGVPKPIG